MGKRNRGVLLLIAALLMSASAAWAQTSGRLIGSLKDPQGAVLPGATVTITSPALQRSVSQVSDQDGVFRFLAIPAGRYIVKVELGGFKTYEQPDVQVGLDRTVDLVLTLQVQGVAETVNVVSASPIVDTTSTSIGINATADLFERIPVRRDFYAIARLAPGTTEDAVGPAVLGSTGAENQYIIDGLNTTGVERAEKTKRMNFDFIDGIDVKTGGLNAEYGRLTGGAIVVTTKSGGNVFRGSVFGFTEGGALRSDDSTAGERPETTTSVPNLDSQWDVGVELGGYIVKDRLWFFGAYNRQQDRTLTEIIRDLNAPGAPARGSEVLSDIDRDLFSGKLTYRLGNSQRIWMSVNGDPSSRNGNIFPISGPESTWKGVLNSGAVDPVITYEGTFGPTFNLRGVDRAPQREARILRRGQADPVVA